VSGEPVDKLAMRRLPGRLEADDVLVRPWRVEDAEALRETILASATHVPSWMAQVPKHFVDLRPLIARWEREWSEGGDARHGLGGDAAGMSWLHPRGRDVLEIGYWIRGSFARRGLAETVAAMLTDGAFSVPRIEWRSSRPRLLLAAYSTVDDFLPGTFSCDAGPRASAYALLPTQRPRRRISRAALLAHCAPSYETGCVPHRPTRHCQPSHVRNQR
jgi:GNAT acetyltransferase-like protein